MPRFVQYFAVLLAAAALSPLAAIAHPGSTAVAPFGHAVSGDAANRTIVLDGRTRYVNVNQSEIVTFVIGANRFTWQFDTLREGRVGLSAIAPEGIDRSGVQIYVGPNPLYTN